MEVPKAGFLKRNNGFNANLEAAAYSKNDFSNTYNHATNKKRQSVSLALAMTILISFLMILNWTSCIDYYSLRESFYLLMNTDEANSMHWCFKRMWNNIRKKLLLWLHFWAKLCHKTFSFTCDTTCFTQCYPLSTFLYVCSFDKLYIYCVWKSLSVIEVSWTVTSFYRIRWYQWKYVNYHMKSYRYKFNLIFCDLNLPIALNHFM